MEEGIEADGIYLKYLNSRVWSKSGVEKEWEVLIRNLV